MGRKIMYLGADELTDVVNDCLDVFIEKLNEDKVLDDETHSIIKQKYKIVIHKKTFFGRLISKVFDDEDFNISVVKIVGENKVVEEEVK